MAQQKRDARQPAARAKRAGVHARTRTARLRESWEQFRLAQETLGIVTWIWDVAADRVQWYGNPARMLGLAPARFSGRFAEYLACVHPQDLDGARQIYMDCLQGRCPEYRAVERVIWPDGSVHWLETYGRAEYGPDGRARRMMGVIKEISEHKREEAARIKAEGLLAHVFEASPEYIVVARANDGRFVAVNTAFERATGYRAEDVVGRTAGELAIWARPGERKRWLAELLRRGSLSEWPVELRARGGGLLSGAMSASLIDHEGDQLVICIVHDLTEIRRSEQKAREAERKFAALFSASPIGLIVTRPRDRRVVEINDVALAILGLTREQAVGAPTHELATLLDREHYEQLRSRALAGERVQGNLGMVRRDGQQIALLLSTALVELVGEQHFVVSFVDVTEQRRVEAVAHQSLAKFAAVFETNPVGIIVTRLGADERIVEVNDAALALVGLPREEMLGAETSSIVEWLEPAERELARERVRTHGRVLGQPLRFRRRSGELVEALFSAARIDIEGVAHLVVSVHDVTEQRRNERQRAVADARYRRLFESAREGLFITTPEHGVLDVNPAGCELAGYLAQEMIGRSAGMLYSEEELRRRPFRTDLTRHWGTMDRVMTRKDGRRVDIEVAAGPMPDGNVLAIVRDITERKRSETLLMNVARGVSAEVGGAFFRSLVEHLARELGADYVFIGELVQPDNDRVRTRAFVADGAIVDNIEYRLEGSPCIHAVSRRGTVLHPEGTAELFPRDAGLKRLGVEAYVGTSLTGAGGAALGVLVVMHRKPVLRGAYWASMIEIFAARAAAEIERARAEALVLRTNASLEEVVRERTAQLEEANRELESYNFSISHDLRQPLNAICGFSELLRESGETGRGDPREYVREIESNAARMEQMIEALLQLSRAGRGTLRREPIDVRAMVQAVAGDLGAGAASIDVADLPGVCADPVLLRQVWTNLIGNALKYSRHSPAPRVEIGGGRRGGFAEFHVRDNGVGFDMRHARRLFTAFQRLPSATDYEGTGVGLAIVERIVRRHGGSIAAEAEPGRGATFRFSLPDEAL